MNDYEEDDNTEAGISGAVGPVPPAGIVSFPSSVQKRLDEAKELLGQNRPESATAVLKEAAKELASASPELFALILASSMGARRVIVEETESDARTVESARYFLGIRVGRDVQTTTSEKVVTRTVRFG